MKLTGLFLLAGVVAVFPKELPQLDSVAQSDVTVCFKKEMILDLTILQGQDGKDGLPGQKGDSGEMGLKGENGEMGPTGIVGPTGLPGIKGLKGNMGDVGESGRTGPTGNDGYPGQKGEKGDLGYKGTQGSNGYVGESGNWGSDGETGIHALPLLLEDIKDLLIHALNDYQVTQSGYYNKLYHVRARDLTDGQAGTGGWGSETALKAGAYIQATFLRPVYVTSVTLAGGFIPSWGSTGERNGRLKLEYSTDGKNWTMSTAFFPPIYPPRLRTFNIQPVTAQYWRLTSEGEKWVGTTEFALKPLIKT